jgi:hypothetical protein
MTTSTYDLCLLVTTTRKTFEIVGMQTDDIIILGNKQFSAREEQELAQAKYIRNWFDTEANNHST